MVEVPNSKGVK